MKREQQCTELCAHTRLPTVVMTGEEACKDVAKLAQKSQEIESVFLVQQDSKCSN